MDERLRLRYKKTGSAKYISHLDLMATIRRALIRAGIELRYSEGFNPHPYISVALPLPVGCGSVCELMDVRVSPGQQRADIPELVSSELPAGIEITEAYMPEKKFNEIAWVELTGLLYYDNRDIEGVALDLTKRFSSSSITVVRKTKRSESEIDIAPFIRSFEFHGDDVVNMTVRVSAQNPSVTPALLMSALDGEFFELAPCFSLFTRVELYDRDMKIFK